MKYINKKLPLMEVGKEINFSLNGVIIGAHCYDDGTLHCTQADFNLLLKDGFIEEVNPREWYELEVQFRPEVKWIRSDFPCGRMYDKKTAELEMQEASRKNSSYSYRIIKVMEVIE